MRNTIDRWWFNNYKENPYVNIQVNQVETCKEMIINKLGYAILANLVVHPYPELTVKTLHSPSGEPITRKTWMYYHAESDRKSTRLNSSHVAISYAVFCLKKKKVIYHVKNLA